MLFAFVAVASFAQTSTRQVTIHVMDVIGEPLIGAKVEIVGSDIGAETDMNGNVVLWIPYNYQYLKVSCIGYITEYVQIQSYVLVVLEENTDIEPSSLIENRPFSYTTPYLLRPED